MSKIMYKGFHTIEHIQLDIKGTPRTIERVGIKNAVAAILTDSEGKIALVKQFRPCIGDYMYEIPAGLKDKSGLTSIQTLVEELEEECEIISDTILYISEEPVHTYYMVCGSSDAHISIYRVALDSEEHSREVNDSDVDRIDWVTYEEFDLMVKSGQIVDAKTLIAYYILGSEL